MKKILIALIFISIFSLNLVSAGSLDDASTYYSFDDANLTGGDDPVDISGNGLDGTTSGNPTTGEIGILGECFLFDGTGDYITISDTLEMQEGDWSISLWFKTTDTTASTRTLFGYREASTSDWVRFRLETDHTMYIQVDDGVSAASLDSDPTTYNNGSWYHAIMVFDETADDIYLYINNVLIDSDIGTLGSGANSDSGIHIGRWIGAFEEAWIGYIDELSIYSRKLSADNRTALFNDNKGFNPYEDDVAINNIPTINYTLPVNNTRDNSPLFINFTYIDADGDNGNCTVYINNSDESHFFIVTNNSWYNYTSNMTVDDYYTFHINCTDNNSASIDSGNYIFQYDSISPTIIWINPVDNSSILFPENETLRVKINYSDSNLFKYLVNITYTDGTSYYENVSDNLTESTAQFDELINISTFPYGKFNIFTKAVDSHTKIEINPYEVDIEDSKLSFDTEEDIFIEIYSKDESVADYLKTIDSYEFSFDFVDKEIEKRIFTVKSEDKIYYIKNSNYKAHFVILNDDMSGNWIDFEGVTGTPIVKKISNYEYTVEFPSILDKVTFKSIGGLNSINSTRTFIHGRSPIINYINISPVVAYYNDTLNCSFSAYHSDSDELNATIYFLDDGVHKNETTFTNISHNISYSIILNSSEVSPNEFISCYINVSNSYITIYNNTNITISDYSPVITNYTPDNTSFIVAENTTQSFNVTATDDDGTVWYAWFLDSILQAITDAWDWIIGFDEAGDHEVLVIVNDSSDQNITQSWNVTVTNINIAPVVNSLSSIPAVTYQNFGNQNIVCNATDEDTANENLSVTIQYKDSNDILWVDTTENYNAVTHLWISTFDPATTDLGYMDFRCKANDGVLDSDWFVNNDVVLVLEIQYTPTLPVVLSPVSGNYDYSVLVSCSGAFDQNIAQRFFYEIQYSINDVVWINLSTNEQGIAFIDLSKLLNYSDTVDLRCRTIDEYGFNSSYFNPAGELTRRKDYQFFIFNKAPLSYYLKDRPIQLGVFADFTNINNTEIEYNYFDCNGDGLWDHISDKTDKWAEQESVKSFEEYYWCTLPEGIVNIESGIMLKKNSTNWNTKLSVCNDVIGNYCVISKKYNAFVR